MPVEGLEQPHSAHAVALAIGSENQMIEYRQVDRFAGLGQGAGGAAIGYAWAGVTTGMVMREDNAGAAEPHRIGDDRAYWQADRGRLPVEPIKLNALRRPIEVRDQQFFGSCNIRREGGSKEASRRFMAVEQSRGFDTLIPHCHLLRARLANA